MSATSPAPNAASPVVDPKTGQAMPAWYRFFSAAFFKFLSTDSLRVTEGANARQGTATLVNGAVTVSNTSVTDTSRIFLTIQSPSGTVGSVYVSARSAGASFTISSTSATDNSTVAYEIFERA